MLTTGAGLDVIENFQLGQTHFEISLESGSLNFQRVNNGVEISVAGDVLAFVNNTQVSIFESELSNIFVRS